MPICAAAVNAARVASRSCWSECRRRPCQCAGPQRTAPGQNEGQIRQRRTSAIVARVAERSRVSGHGDDIDERAGGIGKRGRLLRSWLDDASLVEPGDVWIGLATGYWRGASNRQIDAPVVSTAVGIIRASRQAGARRSITFAMLKVFLKTDLAASRFTANSFIADPLRAPNAIGVALTPLLELSPGSDAPVGWALPVNLEARRGDVRLYGSAGYFSRGSVFGTIGADIPLDLDSSSSTARSDSRTPALARTRRRSASAPRWD